MRGRGLTSAIAGLLLAGLVATAAFAALRYRAPEDYAAGGAPFPIAVADFNSDDRKDVAVGNEDDDTVTVLLGRRGGEFRLPLEFPTGDKPFGIEAARLTGGPAIDLAVVGIEGDTVSVHRGRGDGTFAAPMTYPVGDRPASLAIAPLDRVAGPDLAVGNLGDDTVSILRSKLDGTFGPQNVYDAGNGPTSVALLDTNRDSAEDLIVLDANRRFHVFRGRGNATFESPDSFRSGAENGGGMVVGDLNGDRRADVVAVGCVTEDRAVHVSLRRSSGPGYRAPVRYNGGECSYESDLTDLDGDGARDVIVSNETTGDVNVFRGTGDGRLRAVQRFNAADTNAYSVEAARLNADRIPDFIVPDIGDGDIEIVLSR